MPAMVWLLYDSFGHGDSLVLDPIIYYLIIIFLLSKMLILNHVLS